jgi:hypothetical protein
MLSVFPLLLNIVFEGILFRDIQRVNWADTPEYD